MKSQIVFRYLLLLILILGINRSEVFAQRNFPETKTLIPESEASKEQISFPEIKNYDGTYQFILKAKKSYNLHNGVFDQIERSRKENEDYILILSKDCEVYIPSKSKINSKEFEPYKTPYILK